MKAGRTSFALALTLMLVSISVPAQVAIGTPPFGSFSTGGPDVINLGNLNAHWEFPIVSKAGRGLPFTYSIPYDSSIWAPTPVNGALSWLPSTSSFGWPTLAANSAGLPGNIGYSVSTAFYSNVPCNGGPYTTYGSYTVTTYTNWTYTDGSNTVYSFGGPNGPPTSSVSPNDGCPIPQGQWNHPSFGWATFSNGFSISVTNYTNAMIKNKSGVEVTPGYGSTCGSGVATTVDLNGNTISEVCGVYTDTLGQTALAITGGTSAPPVVFSQSNATGTSTYTLKYSTQTVRTSFGCSNIGEYGPTSQQLPSELDYPDGSKYTFVYEPTPGYSGDVTGRIQSVGLPYGGTITYLYSGGANGINCADGSASTISYYGPDGQTTYSRSNVTATTAITTITYPSYQGVQNQTKLTFNSTTYGQNYYEVARQVYSGSVGGTPLETVLTCYDSSFSSCATTASNAAASNGSFGWGNIFRTMQRPDQTGISSGTMDSYNYGIDVSHVEYDYGSAGSGVPSTTPLKTVNTNIAGYGSPSVYVPSEVKVLDSTSNVISDTKYNHNETSPIATSGTPQFSPTGNQINLTSVQQLVSGSTWLTSNISYYDTGNRYIVTDVNGGQTTYTYGSGSSCGNSLPTSVTSQTGGSVVTSLTASSTWNCVGGVKLTDVDANGNTTTYGYGSDPYWRPVSVTNNVSGQVTNYGYPGSGTNSTSVSMTFNGGSSISNNITFLDALNRPNLRQTRQGPSSSTYDTVAIAYDSLGRVASKTLPYSGTLGNRVTTNPGTATTYDALNRPTQVTDSFTPAGYTAYTYAKNDVLVKVGPAPGTENLKQRNLEYNGAGWLTSVCEVVASTLPAGGACGQTSSYTGYLTKYSYDGGRLTQVQQNAQSGSSGVQTRTVVFDDLGRKTSESIPEWSAGNGVRGTTTYAYDTDSTCGVTSKGDLIKTVDNVGNVICSSYDSLHRLTSSSVLSGPYASVTPPATYVYDAATCAGFSVRNAAGNLAEAYTGTSGSKTTDLCFTLSFLTSGAYAGGVVRGVLQATIPSGSFWGTSDLFYPNGALGERELAAGTNIPFTRFLPNITYGVDGEGRPNTATDTTNSLNLVTAASYNPASMATSVTFGNGDSDSFGYDPSTNRPTSLLYTVTGGSPFTFTTNLTWNANWSLGQMQIADTNNSGNNQTCTYSADDLKRVASVNCGSSTWAQNFTYDAFGNINKAGVGGATSYIAAYSAVTNQVSGGPGYDKNGNQLNSTGLQSISWNAAGNPISVTPLSGGAIAGTYDAFGRLLATTSGSTTRQFVYAPSGAKFAVIQNGALSKETVSLPGGETAIYSTTAGPPYIRHTDWLGSSRLATTWAHGVYSKESYAPFGEVYNEAGTPDRSFTGQDQDTVTGAPATGIYDFLFRKYDPSAGRWLSPDPSGWGATNGAYPQSLNRYAYVQNQPLYSFDPDGLSCISGSVGNVTVMSDDGDGLGCAAAGIPPSDPSQIPTNDGTPGVIVNGNGTDITPPAPLLGCDFCLFQYQQATQILVPAGGITNPNGTISTTGPSDPPKKLTPGQIQDFCKLAAMFSAGGTVAGNSNQDPMVDTEATTMNLPSKQTWAPMGGEYRGSQDVFREVAPGSGNISPWGAAAAGGATYANCVYYATQLNN
jgi:RHS repeat-associated protein